MFFSLQPTEINSSINAFSLSGCLFLLSLAHNLSNLLLMFPILALSLQIQP